MTRSARSHAYQLYRPVALGNKVIFFLSQCRDRKRTMHSSSAPVTVCRIQGCPWPLVRWVCCAVPSVVICQRVRLSSELWLPSASYGSLRRVAHVGQGEERRARRCRQRLAVAACVRRVMCPPQVSSVSDCFVLSGPANATRYTRTCARDCTRALGACATHTATRSRELVGSTHTDNVMGCWGLA